MGIRRRFFLQVGLGVLIAPVIPACNRPTSQAGLKPSAPLQAAIKDRGHLLVATEDYYPPFEFLVNGKPAGLDHELLTMLQKRAPFEVRQEILPWQPILPGVGEGKFDAAITAASITDDRAKFLDFTMPISETTQFYLKRQGDARLTQLKDLAGRTIGVQRGGVSAESLPYLEAALKPHGGVLGTVQEYGSFDQAYRDLESGRLDAVVHNIVSLSILLGEKPGIFELGEAVSPRSYAAWAVKKGNQPLLDYLNQFLAQVRQSGELAELQQYWLKRTFELPDRPLLPGDRPI
ncbi:MAG TPA: transporter substrate-binding domain-containing protein [Trichocoleus sp.]